MYRINTHKLTAEERTAYRFNDRFQVSEYANISVQIGISRNGKIHAMAYSGKKLSPDWNYTFRNEEHLQSYISRYIENHTRHLERKAEYKANRKPSEHAKAAKAIRNELKLAFPGIAFSVTSDIFAGGNSVRISWTDGPTSKQVDDITSKYQYGHFDGMTDCYYHSNGRADIPQSKYVQAHRTLSEQARAAARAKIEKKYGIDQLNDRTAMDRIGCYADTAIYRELVNKPIN